MSTILPIDKQTVHRICSGQVVLDLAMAVKELVENSVDAGATTIEIKFKDNGVDGFEVIDNGSGIAPENYESLTLKHYTSKIERFEDLESVTTFGFRGEALSSLCSLCELVVTTATREQAPRGVRLVYDSNGHLVSQTPVARSVGTTVQLTKLFHTLPVRQQEFKRNAKREYGKALSIIQTYGIISNNIKISATNQVGRVPHKAISTNGNKAVRENILNLFGAKILAQIMPFEVALDPLLKQNCDDHDEEKTSGVIHGFISKPETKCGRGSGDRQYFYINGRPCVLPKLAKALNELYRSFITNEYPFVVADIRLAPDKYDVNVTPDKRTILLHDEQAMIEHIIEDLREQLEPSRSTFVATPFSYTQSRVDTPTSPSEPAHSLNGGEPTPATPRDTPPDIPRTHFRDPTPRITPSPTPRSTPSPRPRTTPPPVPRLQTRSERTPLSSFAYSKQSESIDIRKRQNASIEDYISKRTKPSTESVPPRTTETADDPMEMVDELAEDDEQSRGDGMQQTEDADCMETDIMDDGVIVVKDDQKIVMSIPGPWYTRDIMRTVEFQAQGIKSSLYAKEDISTPQINMHTLEDANLTNVNNNETAVAALRRVIKKTDFAQMKVIGQFNLGFIVTMLDGHDLFIVDQHASDEKYNFETLQLTTKLQGQRLIEPQNAELTAAEELVVMENQEIIRANGFDLEIDESREPTQRIRVISQPMSNDIIFDKKDFGELVHALSERPGQMVRCSRARRIFASKACRKSVMIGHPLNPRKMRQIVRNMGDLEQPWNCPHGRPTMRHLCSITTRSANSRKKRAIEVKGSLFR